MVEGRASARAGGPAHHSPAVYSIAAHRGFADALVAGLIPRYGAGPMGLAGLTLLVPSQRAARTITEAFIRAMGAGGRVAGLLLPRLVAVGDLDLDEALGPLFDPLDAEGIAPAADPTRRWLRLAGLLAAIEGPEVAGGAARLRRAREAARMLDRLQVEGIAPDSLLDEEVIALVGEQAEHWRDATRDFLKLHALWRFDCAGRGEVDPPERRNALFAAAAARWQAQPPAGPIVAAGVTSASPALARLLRVVAGLPDGAVILPDFDLAMDEEVWAELGLAGAPAEAGGPAFGSGDAVTHPQYHLKLLLNRMGVARTEVQPWHRAGLAAAPPERARALSALFLPPQASARWVDLPEPARRLAGVRLMPTAGPAEEARALAILIRQALEEPGKRVALVTPDRALAGRVVAQLGRWGIAADDSAGQPLTRKAAGRLALLLAEVAAEGAPPVPLIALLSHPLVGRALAEMPRGQWLEQARALDLALRGPRPDAGLAPLRALVEQISRRQGGEGAILGWWQAVEAALAPLFALPPEGPLADQIDALILAAEALCGEAVWAEADGRLLGGLLEDWRAAAAAEDTVLPLRDLPAALRDGLEEVAVRPAWGGHPRVAIYGLLEARMARADLMLCAGLVEGVWPGAPAPEPLLPPALLRHLGVPGADFRIGLAAHDLAACLGAPQVVLSWAARDASAPVIPSRFVLRVEAMLGADLAARHHERQALEWAAAIDSRPEAPRAPRPQPMPSADQRRVDVAVTALDRLRADPYQFYAQAILGLARLDPLDSPPTPAWRGTAVHGVLDAWHRAGAPVGGLAQEGAAMLDRLNAHPLTRSLWRPRLLAALEWIDAELLRLKGEGRQVLATEIRGEIRVDGIRIHGRADRIDRLPEGPLAIVDYKTGKPPSGKQVAEGFALQLGLIGLIAEGGGFKGIGGEAEAFEYWSLSARKGGDGFGWREEPIMEGRKRSGIPRADFLPETERFLREAIARWLLGAEPFTARLNPDIGGYNDYDQLMRLDEWIGTLEGGAA